ncbi:plasmid mobilization protein [Heminiphilus faecis]|uniref:plasmid mobilization protein n=1 Tax=Heminiphilus faecis TaxID=2601703 RepID=UPI001247C0DF|nr:hypothetical protein [Heminiphilus faecis]
MKQNFKKAGRHPKIDPTAFRCSVNFTAKEHSLLQTMHEKSGIDSLSAFIKMQVFGKTFKVHYMDDATRIFIDKLSALNARYRMEKPLYFDPFGQTEFTHLGHNMIDPLKSWC